MPDRLTIDHLIQLEPKLGVLLDELRAVKPHPHPFCANALWYGYHGRTSYRERLSALVGWGRNKPLLAELAAHPPSPRPGVLYSSEAYDVAYEALYAALPDCEHGCSCSNFGAPNIRLANDPIVPALDYVLAWTPHSAQVGLFRHGEHIPREFVCTTLACNSNFHKMTPEQRKTVIFIEAYHLIVADGC